MMDKIQEIYEMICGHLTTQNDTAYTDRQVLIKVGESISDYITDSRTKITEGCCDNRCLTNYDKALGEMSLDTFADLNVKLVLINNTTVCWCTSYGQLYPFEKRDEAIRAMKDFLSIKI